MSVSDLGDPAFRISAQAAANHVETGQPVTILDARSLQAWIESPLKVRGAIRIDREHFRIDPSWPKNQLTVVYCT
jgi:hypothetical protein